MRTRSLYLIIPMFALGLLTSFAAYAFSAEEAVVSKRVEAFRIAQMEQDRKALDELTGADLSYSHSEGRVEDKSAFLANATSGKSRTLSLQYKDLSIRVVGEVAIVRFHWIGESEAIADGKKSSTNLHILMTWQRQAGTWKLLSRGSTKL